MKKGIGEKLALIEIRTAVAAVFSAFDLKLQPGQKMDIFHRVTMSVRDGVFVSATRRKQE